MKSNVGKIDKNIRLVIGLIVVILGLYYNSWWGLLGIIPIATALINWCPLYVIFGIKTCKKPKK